jgi:prefoldin subunit 5
MSVTKQFQENNTRGIPTAEFIEDIPGYITKNAKGEDEEETAEANLKELHNTYGKYKFMESSLVQQKKGLVTKIPNIKDALVALAFLVTKKDKDENLAAKFEVADAVYASAEIKPADRVMLWLGANVMLEYNYAEAHELLTLNLKNAKTNLDVLENDLAFLKDQITISEVNIARVHNHKVQLRQNKAKGATKKAIK